jgi:heterodisulfide reductase subunit A
MAEESKIVEPTETSQTNSRSMADEPRIGVYICDCGGNISDTVRCEQAAKVLGKLPNVTIARHYPFMCSDPGQKLITDDIKENGVNRVVVGACSLFLHEQTFRKTVERAGLNPYLYTHVGLREQDSWVHHGCSREATEKAIRMMSAGIAKARLMKPLEAVHLDANKHVLVIGGGLAGLRSALSIARRGLEVTLIEKNHFLGGHLGQWDHVFPTNEDARVLLQYLIENVLAEPNITIYTGSEVVSAKGYVGNFEISIRQQPRGVDNNFDAVDEAVAACPIEVPDEFSFGLAKRKAIYRPYAGCYPSSPVIDREHCTKCKDCLNVSQSNSIHLDEHAIEIDLKVGAVVIATGFTPYEPFHGELGYGEFPEVITLPQLERLLSSDISTESVLKWNGHSVRSMAMIHCVGSRQIEGVHKPQPDGKVNDYCSRVCCTATLSAANRIRERLPDINIYDVYQDIRTYGRGHEDYYSNASKNRVTFLRYLGEEIPEVLQAEENANYPLLVKVKDHLTWGEEIELPVDLVVLSVGMMPSPVKDLVSMLKVAPGNDRFLLEVHPKLRPVETAVAGVVLAGTAQGPMNIQESCVAAEAAAAKVSILLHRGKVDLEPYVARVDPERCNGTGECACVCPQEDTIHLETFIEDGKTSQRAVVTAANCNGCGVCVSACPNGAIDVQGWRLDEFNAMVEAITADTPVLEGAL